MKTFNEKLDDLLIPILFGEEGILKPDGSSLIDQVIYSQKSKLKKTHKAIIDLICEAVEHIHTDNAWTVDTDLYYGFCEGSDEFKRNLINIVRGK